MAGNKNKILFLRAFGGHKELKVRMAGNKNKILFLRAFGGLGVQRA